MSLFSGRGLLVSLPGTEIDAIRPAGSLMPPHEVLAAPVSGASRRALQLLCDAAAQEGGEIQCLAYPEMFTNPVAMDWLRARTAGMSRHVCLSDGTILALLPGFETYAFVHARDTPARARGLRMLGRRAPELGGQLAGQINARFAFGAVRPASVFLGATRAPAAPRAGFWPFFLNAHSVEDSINRILARGSVSAESLAVATAVQYVPLTETALADRGFAEAVAETILKACFDLTIALVLRLPDDEGRADGQADAERLAAVLTPLQRTRVVLPRIAPRNIVFATGDIDARHSLLDRRPFTLLVHESFDFWRHEAGFYALAARVTVRGEAASAYLPDDVTEIYGPNAVRQPLAEMAGAEVTGAEVAEP